MLFFIQDAFLFAGSSLVADQLCMVLVAVQLDDVDVLFIGRPADVGEITVGRVACLQVNDFSGFYLIYAYGHFMAGHARHRIFVRFKSGDAGRGIYLRVIGHHALVHAVEGQIRAFRAPERTFHDAELVAVNRLAVNDVVIYFLYTRWVRTYRGGKIPVVGNI